MVNMEEYEGSPELDVDLELLSVYEKRLERAIRCDSCPANSVAGAFVAPSHRTGFCLTRRLPNAHTPLRRTCRHMTPPPPPACSVKDKVRRLARHHKVFLSDVTKLNDNLERAKTEARHALEAKKRLLQQALDRRCGVFVSF